MHNTPTRRPRACSPNASSRTLPGTRAKMLVGCGVQRVVFLESYPDPLGREILQEAGVVSIRHQPDEAGESRRQSEEP